MMGSRGAGVILVSALSSSPPGLVTSAEFYHFLGLLGRVTSHSATFFHSGFVKGTICWLFCGWESLTHHWVGPQGGLCFEGFVFWVLVHSPG